MKKIPLGRVPLERALSKLGVASRTEARKWILEGRVTLAGRVIRDPLRPVVPESGQLAVDGKPLGIAAPLTVLLHKTKGVVTTRSDEKGRPTVYSLLGDLKTHVVPVGRLDYATTGLLLLTNDTRFADWLTDPRNGIPRVYVVTVRGNFNAATAERLKTGIKDEGETLAASAIEILKASGKESHLRIELTEGKNREIRRMLLAAGHEVTRLKRISFGGLELGDLAPGKWREIPEEELHSAFPGAPLRSRPRG